MSYNPKEIIESYEMNAHNEEAAEREGSLRVEIPRAFIKTYLQPSDVVLDAGGGAGINAILMAQRCQKVTLLDLTPGMLALAKENIRVAGLSETIDVVEGDITDLSRFDDGAFSFVVCVGDSISYVLDGRFKALSELVRVARDDAVLVIGCDSKLGFMRMKLSQGLLEEALEIHETSQCYCVMGPRTHLYTVNEMTALLEEHGCEVLDIASTPTLTDTFDTGAYMEDEQKWAKLKALDLELCTRPELLGMGLHLLFVARKRGKQVT